MTRKWRWLGLRWGRLASIPLLCAALLCPATAQGPPTNPDPAAAVDWMRALIAEDRLRLSIGDEASELRLFAEVLPDGRSWMQFISDTIADGGGTAGWARIDEAVSLMLAESEALKARAVEVAGTPEELELNAARKLYLQGAAALLARYRTAATAVFDEATAPLQNLPSLPDWVLPGEIRLHEIAGAGRINVETLDFSGRLSGLVELPGLEANLAVPNLSFDSRGNIDLLAYGETVIPPGEAEGLKLSIPARRPLSMHLGEAGDFSIAGGVRLEFPGGNELEGFFDVNDPAYAFGLAFSGRITLEMAQSMEVTLPVLDVDTASASALTALAGFGDFFGSFARGLESFLDNSPDLPGFEEISIGAPPEFLVPETVVPTDVIGAWIVQFGNEFVRPAVNAPAESVNAILAKVREAVAELSSDLESQRTGLAPELGQIRRLKRIAQLNGDMKKMLEDATARQAAGEGGDDLLDQVSSAADQAETVAREFLESTPADADPRIGMAAARAYVDVSATATLAGGGNFDPSLVVSKLDSWTAATLAGFGFNADGTVADASRVAGLSEGDLRLVAAISLDADATVLAFGGQASPGRAGLMFRRYFERVRAGYEKALASGDLESRVVAAVRLVDLAAVHERVDFPASASELGLMTAAWDDTFEAIASRGGGAETGRKLATSFMQAGERFLAAKSAQVIRRRDELLGSPDRSAADGDGGAGATSVVDENRILPVERTIWENFAGFFAGAATGTEKQRRQANLEAYARGIAEAAAGDRSEIDTVGQDMEGKLERLKYRLDVLAFLDAVIPGNLALLQEFEASWEALHLRWTPVAEAQNLHWMLAEYLREMNAAATRYGAGVSAGLRGSLAVAGEQAGQGLERVTRGLSGLVGSIGDERFSFALPGDIEIRSLYGELAFDRISLDWDLAFGGRLEFPDINANFEIARATLDDDGEFSIAMSAASDTAFGLSDDFSLTLEVPDPQGNPLIPFAGALPFPSNGFTPRLDGFSGRGSLLQQIEGGEPQSYDVGVTYLALDPGHRFTVETQFAGQRELFTPEIMMFTGGFGFQLETALDGIPTQGGAEVDANLGLLLRPGASEKLPELRVAADYFLNFSGDARVEFSTADQTVDVTLVSGMLTLPADIFSGPGDSPPTISLLTPVCARFDFDSPDGLISWCDVDGNPVRLAIDNLGFEIPGLAGAEAAGVSTDTTLAPEASQAAGFEAGVSAVLLLSGTDFPVIEKINAALVLPIPGQAPDDPADSDSATFLVEGENWRIDGLPDSASIALGSPLKLLDLEGLEIEVMANAGTEIGDCPAGLSFVHDQQTGASSVRIASAMKVTVDPSMITSADPVTGLPLAGEDAILAAQASGCFEWRLGEFPTFTLGAVEFSGRFRLGGPQGIEIKGLDGAPAAFVRVSNVASVFDRSPSNLSPFMLELEGAVNFADTIEFGLVETAFIWDGTQPIPFSNPPEINNFIPRFVPGGFYAALGENAIELGSELLPLYPTKLGLRFRNGSLPLIPGAGMTGLFDPSNLMVIVSGSLSLPNGVAIDSGSPGIFGSVDDLEILFEDEPGTGFPIPVFTGIDSLCLGLSNLDIPPLGGITGSICVQNLDDPLNLFFIGEAGATVNDMGASVLLAMKPTEFIGACFDLNAGPAGIPLDGGTLGGILLTGGRGGINFKNSFADPCDFESYLDTGHFPPEGSEQRPGSPVEFDDPDYAYPGVPTVDEQLPMPPLCVAPTQPQFDCIQGKFPPPSINPLCERITLAGGEERIIFKGTALTTAQVDQILALVNLSPTQLDMMRPGDAIDAFVVGLSGEVRKTVDEILDCVPEETEDRARAFYCQKVEEIFNSLDDAARNFLREGFRAALKADPEASIYQIIVQKAAEGIPCFDVTLKIGGTLSHSTISSVLTGSGDVTLSSTGTAVLEGRINLIGIPVGEGTLAFSLTDDQGTINPSFGGVVTVALGPLELGDMSMSLSCQSLDGGSCFDAVVMALSDWIQFNAGVFDAEVSRFMIEMMDATAPRYDAGRNRIPRQIATGMLLAHFEDLSDAEKFNWYSSFLNIFQIVANNAILISKGEQPEMLPVDLGANAEQTLEAFLNSYKTLVFGILTNVNPRICFSGDVGPKLFGFPLTGGADTVLGGGMLYERVIDETTDVDFQQVVAQVQFSPSYLMLAPLTGGALFTAPAFDQSSMAYSLSVEAFTEENICTMLTDPLLFASDQSGTLVEDSVLSFGYQLQPLGYRLADGQGRVIFPRIGGHPCNSNRFKADPDDPESVIGLGPWVSPDDLNQVNPSIPTRREIILVALSKGQLQNPLWRGSGADLAALFSAPGTDCYVPSNPGCLAFTQQVSERVNAHPDGLTALRQLDFANDYFPHGGFIGGAEFALPKLLADPPPAELLTDLLRLPAPFDIDDFQSRWLKTAKFLFANPADETAEGFGEPGFAYFTGTSCVGQMALYVPAPNPPAAVFGGDDAQALFDAVRIGNFEDIVNGSAGIYPDGCPVYPGDQLLLNGWMDVPVLGLPVAQGLVEFDPQRGCFSLEAAVLGGLEGEPQTWLHEMVGASMKIEMKAPDYLEQAGRIDPDNPVVGGTNDRMSERSGELESLNNAGVAGFLEEVFQQVPRGSAEVEANLAIPSELDAFLRIPGDVGGERNARFFAYSPFFDPSFGLGPGGEVIDQSPIAVARRRGGLGVTAGFEFGFFPDGSLVDEQLVFNVGAEASLALTPDADLAAFPALSGQLEAFATLPGVFSFDGSQPEPFGFAGLLRFNSSPAIGEDWIAVDGALSAIDLGPFLQVTPLPADANPDNHLGGSIAVTRTAGAPAVGLALNAAAVNVPALGALTGHIYGTKTPRPGLPFHDPCNPDHFTFTPFTFSTLAGERWSATMDLCGAIEVRSPFDTSETSPVVFRAEPLTQRGNPIPFTCEIEGMGLESFELRLQIPNGITFTLFPGTAHESVFTSGSNSATCFLINSEGRMYFDSGTRDLLLALPGPLEDGSIDPDAVPLAEVRGRIELGFEPVDTRPEIARSPSNLSMNSSIGNSTTKSLVVTNTNRNASQLIVDASLTGSDDFQITPSRLILGGGESKSITVRFTPRTALGKSTSASLLLAHNAPHPGITVPLSGTVTTEPKFHITTASIDFGATPIATPKSEIVTVTNTGTSTLNVSNIVTTGTAFSDNRTSLKMDPGTTRTIAVTFEPTSASLVSGSLTMSTNDPSAPTATVSLSGSGSDRFWYRQRKGRGDFSLHDIAFFAHPTNGDEGLAAGSFGAFFRGVSSGQIWERGTRSGNHNFKSTVKVDTDLGWMVGSEKTSKGNTDTHLGRAWKTSDGGSTWSSIADSNVTGAGGSGTTLIWNSATTITGTSNVALAGEFNGEGRIVTQAGATSFNPGVLSPSVVPRLNGIAFGSATVGLAVGDDLTVMRTADGGKTWTRLVNLPALPPKTALNAVAANPFGAPNYVVVGDGGVIIRTVDAGTSWTSADSKTSEDLYGVVRAGSGRFFAVGDDGTILRGSSTGLTGWTLEDAQTSEDFRGITAAGEGLGSVSSGVWAVTRDGGIFHRQSTAISGPVAVVNIEDPLSNENGIGVGERYIREVRFSNEGVSDLTTHLKATGGDAAAFEIIEDVYLDPNPGTPGTPIAIPPGCEGVYAVVFESNSGGAFGTTLDISTNDSRVDKSDPQIGVLNRNPGFSSLGYLTAPGCIDLGSVPVGGDARHEFNTVNIGEAPVTVHGLEVRHAIELASDVLAPVFEATIKSGEAIGEGKSDEIQLEFRAPSTMPPGVYRSRLEIASNARNAVVSVEVIVRVVQPQQVVVIDTNLPGLSVNIDPGGIGRPIGYQSPAVFTIVDGAPANLSQIRRGSQVTVFAQRSPSRDGVDYQFQRWTPGAGPDFTFTADGSVARFTAIYAPSRPAGEAVKEPPLLTAAPCDFKRPNDVAFGPWVRITEARLRLPWLGDGSGSDFRVEGALFLSLDRATGSLTSSAVRAVVPPEFGAPFAGYELLEVTPGAWSFDVHSTGEAEFNSLSPGLQILGASALPPTDLALEIDLNAGGLDRRALLRFSTLDDLPVIPGVLAVGPGFAELETALVQDQSLEDQLVFRMGLAGSIRMLARPTSPSSWIINEPVGLAFDATVGIEPYRYPTSVQIADLGLFRLHSIANQTTIGPELDALNLNLKLAARNFQIDVLRSQERIALNQISVGSDGAFNFDVALPASGLTLGPARIEPSSTVGTNENATIMANPSQATLKVQMPAVHLNSASGRWPDDQIAVGAFDFDSTDFALRTNLPSFDLDTIGLTAAPMDADNYFELRRSGSNTSLRLRNRQELFIGGMNLSFKISDRDGVTGLLAGRLGLEGPPPLNLIQDYASMTYDSSPSTGHAKFEYNRFIFGIPTRVRFGGISPPAQGCLLTDKSPEPIEEWPVSRVFP